MNKNENMNNESINAMKDFQKKQIKTNILLHKIIIFFLICINSGILAFIILYKSKISKIIAKNSKSLNKFIEDKQMLNKKDTQINKKLVNIFSSLRSMSYYFSYIFETTEEINLMKNSIKEIYKDENITINPEEFEMYFKFQGITDGDGYYILKNKINYSCNTFILIEAENKIKFGFFIKGAIIQESYFPYDDRENNCFLLFFNSKKIYKCKGDKTKLKINKNKNSIIIIGDDDIIIKDHFLNKGNHGKINFPFKSFENGINNEIELKGEFQIKGLEIFLIDVYNN